MIIAKQEGCTAGGIIQIDGVDYFDVEIDKLRNIVNELTHKYPNQINEMINAILESEGEYEDLGQCDQCGDYYYKYSLEI